MKKHIKKIEEKVIVPIGEYVNGILRACLTFNRTSMPEDTLRGHQYRLILSVGIGLVVLGACAFAFFGEWRIFVISAAALIVVLGWCVKLEYDYRNNRLRFYYFLCADVKEGRLYDRYRFVGLPETDNEDVSFFLTRKKKNSFDINGVYFMCFGKDSEQSGFSDETLKMIPILTEIGGYSNE